MDYNDKDKKSKILDTTSLNICHFALGILHTLMSVFQEVQPVMSVIELMKINMYHFQMVRGFCGYNNRNGA